MRSPSSYISRTLPLAMRGRSEAVAGTNGRLAAGPAGLRASSKCPAQPWFSVAAADDGTMELRLSEVVGALSHALDVTHGQPDGHAARSCLLGMRIAEEIGIRSHDRSALFYALLLKD